MFGKTTFMVLLLAAQASVLLGQSDHYGNLNVYGRLRSVGQLAGPSGTTLPATCDQGDELFKTDTTPGLNKYYCTATNVWTQMLGSSGGGTSVTRTPITFSTTPVFTRASAIQQWSMPLTANVISSTLSGASAGDLLSFEFTQDSTPRVVAMPTGFPTLALCATAGSLTVAQYFWTGSAAIERSVNSPGCTERIIRWSDGTTTTFPAGTQVAATLDGTQTFLGDKSFTGRLNPPNSTTRPATCTVGDIYVDTDATSGQRLYLCETTNTWVVQGGGGGGGGPKFKCALTSDVVLTATGQFTGCTIPAGTLAVGDTVTVDSWGIHSTSTNIQMRYGFYMGANSTYEIGDPVNSLGVPWGWHVRAMGIVRTIGVSGTIYMQGFVSNETSNGVFKTGVIRNASTWTINTTGTLAAGPEVDQGAAGATSTLTTMLVTVQ